MHPFGRKSLHCFAGMKGSLIMLFPSTEDWKPSHTRVLRNRKLPILLKEIKAEAFHCESSNCGHITKTRGDVEENLYQNFAI